MSHRVTQEWMGEHVETLEDLLRPGLRAICIGINPALKSAAAGHYYQGTLGQRFFERLQNADPLPRESGWEDDLGFENGIGFTDIVKRPTRSATEVRPSDFVHGRELLERRSRRSPVPDRFRASTSAERPSSLCPGRSDRETKCTPG